MPQDNQNQNVLILQEHINKIISEINARKEEILEAFVAKYGFHPDEATIVHQISDDGLTTRIWVEKRK